MSALLRGDLVRAPRHVVDKHFGFHAGVAAGLLQPQRHDDDSAYIVVGDKTSYWRESELFIFDGVAFFLAACRNDGMS
jgi:hypothetical protein